MIPRLLNQIDQALPQVKGLSIVLTGGRSAERLYKAWPTHGSFVKLMSSKLYVGDEREIAPENPASNGFMIRHHFGNFISQQNLFLYHGGSSSREVEFKRYEREFPDQIDLLLLSVGEDAHVASLFPGSRALSNNGKLTLVNDAPPPFCNRVSITAQVLQRTKNIIVMAEGRAKGRILRTATYHPNDVNKYPVLIPKKATWVLDEEAKSVFFSDSQDVPQAVNVI